MFAVTILAIFIVLTTINAVYQTRKRFRRQDTQERSECFFFFF